MLHGRNVKIQSWFDFTLPVFVTVCSTTGIKVIAGNITVHRCERLFLISAF